MNEKLFEKEKSLMTEQSDLDFLTNVSKIDNYYNMHYHSKHTLNLISRLSLCLIETVSYDYSSGNEVAVRIFNTPTVLKHKIENGDIEDLSDFEKCFIPLVEDGFFQILFEDVKTFDDFKSFKPLFNSRKESILEYDIVKTKKECYESFIKEIETYIIPKSHVIEKIGLLMLKTILTDNSEFNQFHEQFDYLINGNDEDYQTRSQMFFKSFRQRDCSFSGHFDMALREYFECSQLFFPILDSKM